jgi:hypothetical protein
MTAFIRSFSRYIITYSDSVTINDCTYHGQLFSSHVSTYCNSVRELMTAYIRSFSRYINTYSDSVTINNCTYNDHSGVTLAHTERQ